MARAETGCEVLHQSFMSLALPPERFDGVFANASLLHVPAQELPRVLGALRDALVPRGVFFCSNPHGPDSEGWSGNRYSASIATAPYGKTGSNRLNLTAAGGATSAITIPAGVLDRWQGPAVINSGDVIPRNALEGLPYAKMDLRITIDDPSISNAKVPTCSDLNWSRKLHRAL